MKQVEDPTTKHEHEVEQNGYSLIPSVFNESQLQEIREQVAACFEASNQSVREREGEVYAVRNVLALYPEAKSLGQKGPLKTILKRVLGDKFGLVRGLYFDKPPEQTWALPWHKDLLIAVKEESVTPDLIAPELYSRPRMRIGVPHTEPPVEVLKMMLTLRIHLDPMTSQNGPLEVLPGSHGTGKENRFESFEPVKLNCQAGDVLAMRPLLVHCSGRSEPETQLHRRILHLEFAADEVLPGGVQWWEFHS